MHHPENDPPRAELRDPLLRPPPARRILVIRLGALGDVIRTRFALAGLRALYPQARIDWLVEDRAAAGLVGVVGLDHIVEVPRGQLSWQRPVSSWRRMARLVEELREHRYDLALDFHGILKSALLAWWSRIPLRIGYGRGLAREGSQFLLTHRAIVRPTYLSRFERNAALVHFLGGSVPLSPPPLQLPDDLAVLADLPGRPVVMHPGTSPSTFYKRWEPARYAELAIELQDRVGAATLVTWGPVAGERESAAEVVELARGSARLAPATSSLEVLLGLLSRARLFVGSDSGPMHLASLAGVPVLVLFGPTDPVENAPFEGVPNRVLRHDVGCNPCRKGCSTRPCMAAIAVEEAVKAAFELIAAARPVD
jgi:ADP-heptose:LPS heptosyltransferase